MNSVFKSESEKSYSDIEDDIESEDDNVSDDDDDSVHESDYEDENNDRAGHTTSKCARKKKMVGLGN
jgi:hypothetical protein